MSTSSPPPNPPDRPATARGPASAHIERLSLISLVAALCPLVPVPWLDDFAERVVRRRAVADLLRERGVDPTPGDVEVLAGLERSRRGCVDWLLWPLTGVLFYVAKKLFRKVLFLLAAGDAVRTGSEVFHDTYLLSHALAGGWLPPGPDGRLDRDEARWVRWAMAATTAETDPAPVRGAMRRAFVGSGRLLTGEAMRLGAWLVGERRRAASGAARAAEVEERAAEDLPVAGEATRLAGLSGRLATAIGLEQAYRRTLEARLDTHLATAAEARRLAAADRPEKGSTADDAGELPPLR
ncbi:MAG TPA: hypothetical protein VM617_06870 [Thermoanaerobaculia bacterium]|nr:hypothetical protein [Thermoanaerobaculia bacterium]